MWTFDYPIGGDPSNWSSKRDSWGGGLVEQIPSRPNSRPLVMNGDMEGEFELSKDETLPDLLERLSLSDHLNLFQVRLLKQTGTKIFDLKKGILCDISMATAVLVKNNHKSIEITQ